MQCTHHNWTAGQIVLKENGCSEGWTLLHSPSIPLLLLSQAPPPNPQKSPKVELTALWRTLLTKWATGVWNPDTKFKQPWNILDDFGESLSLLLISLTGLLWHDVAAENSSEDGQRLRANVSLIDLEKLDIPCLHDPSSSNRSYAVRLQSQRWEQPVFGEVAFPIYPVTSSDAFSGIPEAFLGNFSCLIRGGDCDPPLLLLVLLPHFASQGAFGQYRGGGRGREERLEGCARARELALSRACCVGRASREPRGRNGNVSQARPAHAQARLGLGGARAEPRRRARRGKGGGREGRKGKLLR